MFNYISSLAIPLLVLFIIIYGIKKHVPIYDTFMEGAKESFEMFFTMFPCLLGMILGVNILLKSNVLDLFYKIISSVFSILKIPLETIPMMIMRPISGTSTLAILNNLFEQYGPDSLIGRLASIIQGSTDTTFYVITLYFGSIGIKKIKHSLWVGLFADLMGIIASVILVNILF